MCPTRKSPQQSPFEAVVASRRRLGAAAGNAKRRMATAKTGFASAIVVTLAVFNCWLIYIVLLPHGSGNEPFAARKSDLISGTYSAEAEIDPPSPGLHSSSSSDADRIDPLGGNSSEIIIGPVEATDNGTVDDSATEGECDISTGKWVPDARPPLYTNESCKYIQPSQNCMMNGRPDRGFLDWRWKPAGCELDDLDPIKFLEFMRNKKMVFIGDSIARNHMQSLLCALAQIEEPQQLFFDTKDKEMRWGFSSYNFTLNQLWSPFLAQHEFIDGIYHIHLDVPEDVWESQIHEYDVAVLSSGYWYFRPSIYYMNNKILGCNPRSGLNYTTFEVLPAYRLAHRNMLKHMLDGFKGITLLRTITVDHFEFGSWNTGGLCNRTEPFSDSDAPELPWMSNEMNTIQVEEFQKAVEAGGSQSWRLNLLNITHSAFMRPDGHPNTYRIQPANERPQNDCLHWCLPGPIDMWNQLIWHKLWRQQKLKSKAGSKDYRLRQFNKRGQPTDAGT